MQTALFILACLLAVADWIAVARQSRARYVTKPAVMLVLFAWLAAGGLIGARIAFALGVLFSLAGDVFLMMPRRYFLAGLIAFLLAHLAYIAGFLHEAVPLNAISGMILLVMGLTAFRALRYLWQRMAGTRKAYRIGVLIYGFAISGMVITALLTIARPNWSSPAAGLASLGALLFLLSDFTLAYDRFLQPVKNGRMIVRVSYHLGQILLLAGAALHYTF